jgi:hypothetical protein
VDRAGAEHACDDVARDGGIGGEVERAGRTPLDDPRGGVGDVVGVHHRHDEAAVDRQQRQVAQDPGGQIRGHAVTQQRAATVALHDQPRPQPGDRRPVRVVALVRVEEAFGCDLVAAVRERGDPVGGPRLVDPPAVGAGGVGTERRHVHEVRHPGLVGGPHDRTGAVDADPFQVRHVVRRLEAPRQVHDRVGAVDDVRERVLGTVVGEVEGVPRDAVVGGEWFRRPPADADEVVTGPGQAPEQGGADVPAGPGDDDPHVVRLPRRAGRNPSGW